jgi:hypothetical protein
MKQAKGSMMTLMVRIIRANKSGAYDNLLSDKAKQLMAGRLVDPLWYPYDLYKEFFNALCQVEAKNNPRVILQWGRTIGQEVMTSIYKHSIADANVRTAIYIFTAFHRTVFNFGEVEGSIVSNREIQLLYNDFDPEWVNFFYFTTGWLQQFFQLCVGKPITYKILKAPMKGADVTQISLTWA